MRFDLWVSEEFLRRVFCGVRTVFVGWVIGFIENRVVSLEDGGRDYRRLG